MDNPCIQGKENQIWKSHLCGFPNKSLCDVIRWAIPLTLVGKSEHNYFSLGLEKCLYFPVSPLILWECTMTCQDMVTSCK